MSSNVDSFGTKFKSKHNARQSQDIAEEEGLLSGVVDSFSKHSEQPPWSRKRIIGTAAFFIALLISGAFLRGVVFAPVSYPSHSLWSSGEGELRSNGTHDFKRTVLIVSIDGLRADYLDRGLTPNLLAISKNGLRAKSMKPVFPTLTFPNHWAIMTGLYAESHGIIANNFWDPVLKTEFHYNQVKSCWNPAWWLGEPMWETAEKARVITANLMWPGPPKTKSGASSTYFVPWKDHVPLSKKLDQILKWVDLPLAKRPQLIMAYEPSLDQVGHAAGPMSALVNRTLGEVDNFAEDLQRAFRARNLTDIIDIIFVSDHGMTDTSNPELVYIDEILGTDGFKAIEHEDGWPSMGLRFHESANVSLYLDVLLKAADASKGKFHVYTHETMPERYHFTRHERIAPIYVVPEIGYVLTTRAEGNVGLSKGNHGYDNDALEMHAIFVAHGPFSVDVKAQHKSHQKGSGNKHWHSTSDDTYIMERFENVQIYDLVMRLLGTEDFAAVTNGTTNFWDKYL